MSDHDYVDLEIVRRSVDLWTWIEAAQFSRAVFHDVPQDQADATAIDDFLDTLSTLIESWREIAQRNAAPMLAELDSHISRLADRGMFVHWGCANRAIGNVSPDVDPLPVAVLCISHDDRDVFSLALPTSVELEEADSDP
jgi:hypothetical protein